MNYSDADDLYKDMVNFILAQNLSVKMVIINESVLQTVLSNYPRPNVQPATGLFWLEHYGFITATTHNNYKIV